MKKPRKAEVEWMRLYHELTPQERQVARGLVLVKQSAAYIPNTTKPTPRSFEFVQVGEPLVLGEGGA